VRRRDLFGLGAGAIAGLAFAPLLAEAKSFTDSAERRIDIPDEVRRVFPAGPPASVALYVVAPEKMLGWTRAPSPEARPFLPTRYADLPEIGRLTGRGNTVNLENVVRLMPDLVLDVGDTSATYMSLADRVQEQTHIPAVLIGGRLAETAATLRTVGVRAFTSRADRKVSRRRSPVRSAARSSTLSAPATSRAGIPHRGRSSTSRRNGSSRGSPT